MYACVGKSPKLTYLEGNHNLGHLVAHWVVHRVDIEGKLKMVL